MWKSDFKPKEETQPKPEPRMIFHPLFHLKQGKFISKISRKISSEKGIFGEQCSCCSSHRWNYLLLREKCKMKCHIFGLLSVTSVKCTHGWIAPVHFLGMVKNEEIVTILEYFQLLFLLLFLLNGENAFIFVPLQGKYSKCLVLPPLHLFSPFSSYLLLKRGRSSGMGNEGIRESGGRQQEKTRNVLDSKEMIKWKIVTWKWIFSVKRLKRIEGKGRNAKSSVVLGTALSWGTPGQGAKKEKYQCYLGELGLIHGGAEGRAMGRGELGLPQQQVQLRESRKVK